MKQLSLCLVLYVFCCAVAEGSVVTIFARGTTGDETMLLEISGKTVKRFGKVDSSRFRAYRYKTPRSLSLSDIRVRFSNNGSSDGQDRNLIVDRLHLDGKIFQTESPETYSTGTWKPATECSPGHKRSETLHCNGYFQYGSSGSAGSNNPPPNKPPQWVLTFSDNFNGTQLDRSKWNTRPNWGIINDEQQAYSDEAIEVVNGRLRIWAEKIPTPYHGRTMPYRSGMITTRNKFSQTYGRFEIRCKLPKGKGYWPAFWTLWQRPAPRQDEIDIFEAVGSHPTYLSFNLHYQGNNNNRRSRQGEWHGPDFTDGFHIYKVQWDPDRIVWFVDGVERHRVEGNPVPRENMYLLVNLAVGGVFPNAFGAPPDASTPQRAALVVDYVRAYRRK